MKYNFDFGTLHLIKTKNTKRVMAEVIFASEITKNNLNKTTLLTRVLNEGTKNYPTRRDLAIKTEENYSQLLTVTNLKVGNLNTISFKTSFISPKYIKEANYLENVLDLLFESIKNPEFNKNFSYVKKIAKDHILASEEQPLNILFKNAFSSLDKKSTTTYIADKNISKVTKRSIKKEYENMLMGEVHIFLIGDYSEKDVISYFKKLSFIRKNNIQDKKYIINELREKPLTKNKKTNFVQSHIALIYNLDNLTLREKHYSMYIINHILSASGITSRLYSEVREKHSLCYMIRSVYYNMDNLLLVYVSLDKKSIEKAVNLIKKIISSMSKITDDEFINTTKKIIEDLKREKEQDSNILNNYIANAAFNIPLIEEKIKTFKTITKHEVEKTAKKIKLNIVYTLTGEGDE